MKAVLREKREKDLWNRWALSQEWKSGGVMDDGNNELTEKDDLTCARWREKKVVVAIVSNHRKNAHLIALNNFKSYSNTDDKVTGKVAGL